MPPGLPPPTVGLSVPSPLLKPRDRIGRMSVGYPRSEDDYDRQVERMAWRELGPPARPR